MRNEPIVLKGAAARQIVEEITGRKPISAEQLNFVRQAVDAGKERERRQRACDIVADIEAGLLTADEIERIAEAIRKLET